MTGDHAGGLWISVLGKGVHRLADGIWTDRGGFTSLPDGTANTMGHRCEWAEYGSPTSPVGPLFWTGSKVTDFAGRNRLPVGNVTSFYGRRGRVWAGGDYGLALFDGTRFQSVTPETAGAFDSLTGIVETSDGDCGSTAARESCTS